MSREHQKPPDGSARQPDKLIRQIRKLRWMGMEEDAKKVQAEVAQCGVEPAESVLAVSRETD
jgi:hypothetical protein